MEGNYRLQVHFYQFPTTFSNHRQKDCGQTIVLKKIGHRYKSYITMASYYW